MTNQQRSASSASVLWAPPRPRVCSRPTSSSTSSTPARRPWSLSLQAERLPAVVANKTEIIFASQPNPHVSEAVANEVAGGTAVKFYAEMFTIGQESKQCIATIMAARG